MNDMTDAKHIEAAQLCQSQALRIAEIHPSPTNPRKTFPEDEMAEMVASVKRHGVMSPILVRPWPAAYAFEGDAPKYELIAGERRYRAAKAAGLEYISGTVRDLDDHETLELQIIENLHRKDLNELEEAEGYEMMIKRYSYTAEQLAEKIEKSKAYIYARLKLTALCEKAREAFRNGLLDASRALLIARIPLAALQARATEEIAHGWQGPMSYRGAAEHVQRTYMLKLANATFPISDDSLVAGAGQCQPCPKRTGNTPEIYQDVKSADICTDPECFAAKKAAWLERQKSEAASTGKTVITGDDARKIMPYGPDTDLQHYIVLDRPNYDAPKIDGAPPTHRQMLAEAKVETMMVEDFRSGKLVEVAKRSEVKKALVAAGITAPTSSSEREKEAEAQAREEGEFRRRLHRQVRSAFATDISEHDAALDEDDMRLIARQFWSCTWNENQKRLAAIWIESEEKLEEHARIRMLTERINTMTPAELCLLLIDLSLVGQTHINTYSRENTPTHLLDMAKRLCVSPDTIRREMLVEKEEKAAKKKGKASKGAKPAVGEEQASAADVLPDPTGKPAIRPFAPEVGDRVRIREDADAACFTGREGYITQIEKDTVIIHLDSYKTTFRFAREEFDVVPEPHLAAESEQPGAAEVQPETANAGRQTYQVGNRVRYADEGTPEADAIATVQAIHENGNIEILTHSGKRIVLASWATDRWMKPAPLEAEQEPAEDPEPPTRKPTSKIETLYCHPENADLAWTGRGRKPKWVEAWLEKGGTLEQLLAKKRPAHKPKATKAAACEISTPRCDKTLELAGLDVAQPTA